MRLDDNFGKKDSFDDFKTPGVASEWGLAGIIGALIMGVTILLFAVERPSQRHAAAEAATISLP